MAEAFVSFILDRLISFHHQVGLCDPKEFIKISKTWSVIRAVLSDAEQKQVKEERLKIWLEDLRDVSREIEDMLDEWNTENLVSRIDEGFLKVIQSFSSTFNFSKKNKYGGRIKGIRERLVEIENGKDMFNFSEGFGRNEEPERRTTSSLIYVSEICGRALDREIIINKLLNEINQQGEMGFPDIISIIEMGGFGKTTLAQFVYNDERVANHFEQTMWVCVSEPFDKIRIAKAIIEEARTEQPTKVIMRKRKRSRNMTEWQGIHHHLSKSVEGKRFLLVLDDVWNEDQMKWDQLRLALRGGAQGSRILVTTRSDRVAEVMGTTYTHRLGKLSEEDCWLMFSRVALSGREKADREKLEEIGREIVKMCKGVPLVVNTIASLLRLKRRKQDWQHVLESDSWKLKEVERGIFPVLLLSYYDLPTHLKCCFAYCAVFPKDHRIRKDTLIKLWMAQDFLCSTPSTDLEILGEEYFDDLVMRSFFHDLEKDKDGNIISCKMHHHVHDFSQFLMKKECFIAEINSTEWNFNKPLHLTLLGSHSEDVDNFPAPAYNPNSLRTLQIFNGQLLAAVPPVLFNQLMYLRTLNLGGVQHKNIPNSIGQLIHLRFLDLSDSIKLKELPETLSNLCNLQTLKLTGCRVLRKLPKGMRKLINLRHLEILVTPKLRCLPIGIGKMRSLRTLDKFILGEDNNACKIGELKDLKCLRGKLEIIQLDKVADANEANVAELKNKQRLSGLSLNFEGGVVREGTNEPERMESVLEGLIPHQNLEVLEILNYPGLRLAGWVGDSTTLANLVILKFHYCRSCAELPTLGKLPSLEELSIIGMDEVRSIGPELYGIGNSGDRTVFPKLKVLHIDNMPKWEGWNLEVKGVEIMPCLHRLEIWECRKLKTLPHHILDDTLRQLFIWDCPELRCDSLPPLLEELTLKWDVGNVSRSLPSLPNLKSLVLEYSRCVTLPHGLQQLKSLQYLNISSCYSLMDLPKELRQLTMLRELRIIDCTFLGPRCQKETGDDWSIISHIPNIFIEGNKIQSGEPLTFDEAQP